MIYVKHYGNHYIYESVGKGFVRVDAFERLIDVTIDNIWCKRYPIDKYRVYAECEKMLGTKYGWVIIFEQLIRQLSNEKISFVWKPWKGMVCSMSCAKVINSINPELCKGWPQRDPEDKYFDNDSQFIELKNI
jgi:hypothetical protein